MKTGENTNKLETKTLLSVLWIFLSCNYILCDVLSNMEAPVLQDLIKGQVAGMNLTQGFLLFAAISIEIPILMIVLSRVFAFKINKISNIVASVLLIFYQLGSFFMGTAPSMHYIFFSVIEVICNVIIFIIALKWRDMSRVDVQ